MALLSSVHQSLPLLLFPPHPGPHSASPASQPSRRLGVSASCQARIPRLGVLPLSSVIPGTPHILFPLSLWTPHHVGPRLLEVFVCLWWAVCSPTPSSQLARLLGGWAHEGTVAFPHGVGHPVLVCCLCLRTLLLTPSNNLVLQPRNSSDRALPLDRNCLWGKGRHLGQYGAWASQPSGPLGLCPHLESPTLPALDPLF